jgi:hypothetical protein
MRPEIRKLGIETPSIQYDAQRLFDIQDVEMGQKIVIVQSLNKSRNGENQKKVDSTLRFRNYYNRLNNCYYGIPVSKNADGTYNWKQIYINVQQQYDLSNRNEAIEYHIVKGHAEIKGSELNKISGFKARFELFDPEEDARKATLHRKTVRQLEEWLGTLSDEMVVGIGRTVVSGADEMSVFVLRNELEKACSAKTSMMVERMTNIEKTKVLVIITRCLSTGQIVQDEKKGFVSFTGQVLGYTLEGAATALLMDRQTLAVLDARSQDLYTEKQKRRETELKVLQDNLVEKKGLFLSQELVPEQTLSNDELKKQAEIFKQTFNTESVDVNNGGSKNEVDETFFKTPINESKPDDLKIFEESLDGKTAEEKPKEDFDIATVAAGGAKTQENPPPPPATPGRKKANP